MNPRKERIVQDNNPTPLDSDLSYLTSSISAAEGVSNDMQHVGWISDPLPTNSLLHQLPPVLVFVRGGLYLQEVWLILKEDSRYAQLSKDEKNLRLLTALTGALVAIGGSIVSLLMALHVGLLATVLAVTITPLILSSVSIAFFCMTLFRDWRRISKINEKLEKLADIERRQGDNNYIFIHELRTNLIAKRKAIAKDIIFGGISTLATIAFLIVMTVPTFGTCWVAVAALTVIAVSPAVISLGKKLLGVIGRLFSDVTTTSVRDHDKHPCRHSLSNAHAMAKDDIQVFLRKPSRGDAFFEHKKNLHIPEYHQKADEPGMEEKPQNGADGPQNTF